MPGEAPVITIDGPGGTGKGTVAAYLAAHLGWHLLDSGAIYRVLAYTAIQQGVDLNNEIGLGQVAESLDIEFQCEAPEIGIKVVLDGRDISTDIRTEECGSAASHIAAFPAVRQALLKRQRVFQQPPGLVADGRDMGTVVFPDADLKLYLTASPEERAKRRYKQLNAKGISVNLQRLSADIAERDARDKLRAVSPLKPADDAVVIDTTLLDINAVNEQVLQLIRARFPGQFN